MNGDNRKALLFAKEAAIIPIVDTLLTAVISDLNKRTVIFLIMGTVYCVFAIRNYIDLRNGIKENNEPVIVTVTVFLLLLLLLIGAALIISLISGEPVIPGQR